MNKEALFAISLSELIPFSVQKHKRILYIYHPSRLIYINYQIAVNKYLFVIVALLLVYKVNVDCNINKNISVFVP